MVEVIKFDDVEAFTVSFLKSQFATRTVEAGVGTKLPKDHTDADSFVKVSRTGGGSRDIVTDEPTVLLECYGPNTVAASDLARITQALVLASARLSKKVTKATDGGGITFFPDPDTNQPRYQFLVSLAIRGAAI